MTDKCYPDEWSAAVQAVIDKEHVDASQFEESESGWPMYEAEKDYFFPSIVAKESEVVAMLNEKIAAQRTKYQDAGMAPVFANDLTQVISQTPYGCQMDMNAFNELPFVIEI